MINKNKTLELLNYINKPMSKESIGILYATNGIRYDKCEFDTYMGDDIMTPSDQEAHFKWCWNKNIENFKSEGIDIGNYQVYNYFIDFMYDVYYPIAKKDEIEAKLLKLWSFIFDYNNIKSKSDIDTMIDVYKSLDFSLVSK